MSHKHDVLPGVLLEVHVVCAQTCGVFALRVRGMRSLHPQLRAVYAHRSGMYVMSRAMDS
jgi:hypothetical protein